MKMVCNSVLMLRKHNRTVPVKIYFLRDGSRATDGRMLSLNSLEQFSIKSFLEVCKQLNVIVEEVAPVDTKNMRPELKNYFFVNRVHFSNSCEDSVLHIDGDTFINGDVEEIFEKHRECDMAVPASAWLKQQGVSGLSCFGRDIPPFNAAVMLFNKNLCKKWASEILCYLDKTLDFTWFDNSKMPIEEIATNWWASDNAPNIDFFPHSECYPIMIHADLLSPPKSIITHSYVTQWPIMYEGMGKPLDKAIIKPEKPRIIGKKKAPAFTPGP
jgi:hypothetical protein